MYVTPYHRAFLNAEDTTERRVVIGCHENGKIFNFPLNSPNVCLKCLISLCHKGMNNFIIWYKISIKSKMTFFPLLVYIFVNKLFKQQV